MTAADPTPQAEPVVFYRACYGLPSGELVSPHDETWVWQPGLTFATCKRGHRPPAANCGCGLYGLMRPEDAVDMWTSAIEEEQVARAGKKRAPKWPAHTVILLEVLGYGRAEVGSEGCRVEAARINAIMDVGQGIDLTPWANRYDVLVVQTDFDLTLVIEGELEEHNVGASSPTRVGVRIAGRVCWVPVNSPAMFALWQLPVGSRVRVLRELEDGVVVAVKEMR